MFFKDFKMKNKGKWESIINGMEISDDVLKGEYETEKQEEIEMLQEFERRRKFKSAFEANEKLKTIDPTSTMDYISPKQKKKDEDQKIMDKEGETLEDILRPDEEVGEQYDPK
jgi:hypothetical protein